MVSQTFVLFSLAFSNRCLYNTNMTTSIVNENYTTQEKLQILADAAKYDVACTSSGSSRRGKKGELGMQKHAASVIVLLQTEDVSPFSRS